MRKGKVLLKEFFKFLSMRLIIKKQVKVCWTFYCSPRGRQVGEFLFLFITEKSKVSPRTHHPLPSSIRICTCAPVLSRDYTLTRQFCVKLHPWRIDLWLTVRLIPSLCQNLLTSQLVHMEPICTSRLPEAGVKAECWFPSAARIPLSRDTGHHARQTRRWFTVFCKLI